jgi:hypothetical protein
MISVECWTVLSVESWLLIRWDDEMGYWVMFYFGLGSGSGGHADIMIARSTDLRKWEKDLVPLYKVRCCERVLCCTIVGEGLGLPVQGSRSR